MNASLECYNRLMGDDAIPAERKARITMGVQDLLRAQRARRIRQSAGTINQSIE